jgi:flavin reductase (DIM6/NTAB) family NADH-FMN oxidoreductase RutF
LDSGGKDGQTHRPVAPDRKGGETATGGAGQMSEIQFEPGPDTARAFRDALGCYGTGVTVVTAMTQNGPLGMTANSFAAVSLDPPLVLWSPAKASGRHDGFRAAVHFIVHVMGEDQLKLAQHFARQGNGFDAIDWQRSEDGAPILEGCLARFECRAVAAHDAGDHTIIVGRVDRAAHRPGQGLMFKRGLYGGFAERD